MTKLQRIEELEQKLAELKEEVKLGESVDYPCVMVHENYKNGGPILMTSEENNAGYLLGSTGGHGFGNRGLDFSIGVMHPFTGIIEYKNGKPV